MISRRKIFYPISDSLRNYLAHYGRLSEVPLVYEELLRFSGSIPYENPAGEETLWLEVMYPPEVMAELRGLPQVVRADLLHRAVRWPLVAWISPGVRHTISAARRPRRCASGPPERSPSIPFGTRY